MAEIDIKDTRLFVTDTGGDLPPVVFLHGFLYDGRQFDAQIAALSDRYRCVTIDFPGQGRSGRSAVGYSTENLSALMALALQQLDLGPVHFVGLSMGGFAGMRIAVRRPDLLRSLTLINTSAAPHDRAKIPRQLALAGVARVAGLGLPPVLDGAEEEMYGEAFRTDPDSVELRDLWRRRWSSGDRSGLVNTLTSMMKREDFRAYLPAITVPTLIIAGSADVSLPPEHSQQMQGLITGSSYVELPGVGHSSPIEDPAQVTAILERFLSHN
jgi:3-oxoadipate enol-lactonase